MTGRRSDRQTDGQTESGGIDRWRDRQTEGQTDGVTGRWRDR